MKKNTLKFFISLLACALALNVNAKGLSGVGSQFKPSYQLSCSLSVTTTVSNASCTSCNDGYATANVSNGTPPYTYSWTTGDTTQTAYNLIPGLYSYCVTDVNGCMACDSFFVDSTGSCGSFYMYTTVTDASCPTCTDGSATANPSPGPPFTYSWNTTPPQYTQTANGLAPGTYNVCVTNTIGCTACANATISLTSCAGLSVAVATTNASCGSCSDGSASAFPTGGTPPYTYYWSTTDTTQTINGLLGNSMDSITVTDANGCHAYGFAFIDTTNCPGFYVYAAVTNTSCSTCTDGSAVAQVSSGSPPYIYSWSTSPVQTGQTATGLSAGNYILCATDGNGCSACSTVPVGIGNCSAYFYMYPDTSITNYYTAVNMATGVPPLTYTWNWGDGSPTDSGAYPTHTYPGPGIFTICLIIHDAVGCSNTACDSIFLHRPSSTITVNVIPPIATGIHSYAAEKTFSVFPNPTSGVLTLQLPEITDETEVTIYNVLGETRFHSVIKENETNLNLSSLVRGIYFIEVVSENRVNRKRFVKE